VVLSGARPLRCLLTLVSQDGYLVGADENAVVWLACEEPHPLDHPVILANGLVVPERKRRGGWGAVFGEDRSACWRWWDIV